MGRAVWYRVTIWLRSHTWSAALIAVLIAVVLAPALTLLAGARRTASAPDRYVAAEATRFDVTTWQTDGAPIGDRIAELPGVEAVTEATFLFAALVPDDSSMPLDALAFAGQFDAIGGRLVEGRAVDAVAPTEFVASDTWVALGDFHLGDTFTLMTVSQQSATERGFDAEPDGPTMRATLVGVFENRVQSLEDDFPVAVFGPALLDDVGLGAIGVSGTAGAIDMAPGIDLDDLRGELDSIEGGSAVSVSPIELIGQPVIAAVSTQSDALWALAAIVVAAAIVVLTQLLIRLNRTTDAERSALSALGYSEHQATLEIVVRATPPVLAGTAAASTVAWLCSTLFPYGFASAVEPFPGRRADPLVLVGASVLCAVMLLAAAAVFGRHRANRTVYGRGLDRFVRRMPFATASTGTLLAFGRSPRAGSTNGFVVGLGVVLAVAIAALTVGWNLGRLLDDPANWGGDADLEYGQGGDRVDDQVREVLRSDPAVQAVTLYGATTVQVGSQPLGIVAYQPLTGGRVPETLTGRLPQAADEIALGTRVARQLDVGIGDVLGARAPSGDVDLTVVGLAVFPGVEESDGMGDAGLVNEQGLALLDPSDAMSSAAIYLADGAPVDIADRLSTALGGAAIGPPDRPNAIVNLDRVRNVPLVIVAVIGALSLVSLAQIVATSVRRRRRELAVLRALGAATGWRRRVVHWQATGLCLAAAAIAAPTGIVAGRAVYRHYPADIGAPIRPEIPVLWIVALVGVLLVAANAVASVLRGPSTARELGGE